MTDQPASKKPRRGRPPRSEKIHHIFLRKATFELWSVRKKAMGFEEKTHSEFAELLLHQAPGGAVDCKYENSPFF